MGTLRTLLATGVVIAHSDPIFGWRPLDGGAAVILFFVVSGFYMSLVLNRKYTGLTRAHWIFWQNRVLRLWPSYLVALVAMAAVRPDIVDTIFTDLSGASMPLAGLMNLFIIGAEWTQVVGLDSFGVVYFNSSNTTVNMGSYVLLGQNWALALEILFYIVAPFIVIRRSRVIVITALAVIGAGAIIHYDLSNFWRYRSFPGVLIFFMTGAVAYQLGTLVSEKTIATRTSSRIGGLSAALVIAAIAFPQTFMWFLPERHHMKLLIIIFVFGLPFWLQWSAGRSWDRWIGDLSYPVYLIHLPVVAVVGDHLSGHSRGITILLLSLALAAIMVLLIERPIDRIRQRRVRAGTPQTQKSHLGHAVRDPV